MDLISKLKANARKEKRKIILPEGADIRVLKAADEVIKEELAEIILIGNPQDINYKIKEFGLKNVGNAVVIDPLNHEKKDEYIDLMVDLRQEKGLTKNEAAKLIENPLYLACIMIKNGDADGEVGGAANTTADVLRPAFQYIKTSPGVSIVSGAFIMMLNNSDFGENGIIIFADCAVFPDPNEQQLAEIAIAAAKTAKTIANINPKVAMLSFSSKGSAKHEKVDKVVNATRIAKEMAPDLEIDGELQADAALIKAIAVKKAPESNIAGNANVLIFPSLESGNIAYKLVERLTGAQAVGPVLQGLNAPVNDLSRGCSVTDIVKLVAITSIQATEMKNIK